MLRKKDLQKQIIILEERIIILEKRITQLECTHDYKPVDYFVSLYDSKTCCFTCSKCKKTIYRFWRDMPKKQQQALKTLNLVPNSWKIKKEK